jgi:hypothetical protein
VKQGFDGCWVWTLTEHDGPKGAPEPPKGATGADTYPPTPFAPLEGPRAPFDAVSNVDTLEAIAADEQTALAELDADARDHGTQVGQIRAEAARRRKEPRS